MTKADVAARWSSPISRASMLATFSLGPFSMRGMSLKGGVVSGVGEVGGVSMIESEVSLSTVDYGESSVQKKSSEAEPVPQCPGFEMDRVFLRWTLFCLGSMHHH